MAKKLKIKLPKRVAGVKIPKSVRRGPVGQFLNSGAGQILIAEALVAVAGAFAVSRSDPNSQMGDVVRHPIDATRRVGRHAAHAGADQAARMSYALREAARAFREAMEVAPREVAPRDESWQEAAAASGPGAETQPAATSEAVSKKKQPSSRSEPPVPH